MVAPPPRLERAETNFNGKLAAIFVTPVEFNPESHRTGAGLHGIARSASNMNIANTSRKKHFDRLAEKLIAGEAKEQFHLAVYPGDDALVVDDHHCVRRGFDQ